MRYHHDGTAQESRANMLRRCDMRNITKLTIGAVLATSAALAATAPASAQYYPYGYTQYVCADGSTTDVYSYPYCTTPVYGAPAYVAPVYPAPVYAPPVVEPYFGIGLGFGGHRD